MRDEPLEERDDLLFGKGSFMQAKAQAGEVPAGNERQLMPVGAELHGRSLAPHAQVRTRAELREAGLVDEDDRSSLASGFF